MWTKLIGALSLSLTLASLGAAMFGRISRRRVHMLITGIVLGILSITLLAACSQSQPEPTPTAAPNPPKTEAPATATAQLSPLTSPVEAQQTSSPEGNTVLNAPGRIAFHSEQTGDFEIWVINADGTNARQLTDVAGRDIEPAWSPDGRLIAFASGRDDPENLQLYIMNADGSNQHPLFPSLQAWDNWTPAWSPDGKRIAFQTNRDVRANGFDIYVVNADGSNERPLITGPGNQYHLSWSPDGTRIAYIDDKDGDGEVFVANADGSDPIQLTDNYAGEAYPRWSPDGQWILFQSSRDALWHLYMMRPDGSDVRRVGASGPWNDVMGTWSPDGTFIAFSSDRAEKDWEIYIMPVEGSGWQRLTFNFPQIKDRYPAWTR